MKITRVSNLTGKEHTQEINVTQEQIDNWKSGMLIQKAMPNLTADEREFLMSGVTKEEWDNAFGEEDEEEDYDDTMDDDYEGDDDEDEEIDFIDLDDEDLDEDLSDELVDKDLQEELNNHRMKDLS